MPRKPKVVASGPEAGPEVGPVAGPDGFSGSEPDTNALLGPEYEAIRDGGPQDDDDDPDPIPTGILQWILREKEGQMIIEDGPFDAADEEEFDDTLTDLLSEHPFDEEPSYFVLVLTPGYPPALTIEDLGDYIIPLIDEAWNGTADDDDWENDSLGG
jgi:hypothetical protein